MIGAFFAILKIIAFLFILIIALIVLITFWPIKYSAEVKYEGAKLDYEVEVSWLIKLVSFYMSHNAEREKMHFRIAWLKIAGNEKDNEQINEDTENKTVQVKKISEENANESAEISRNADEAPKSKPSEAKLKEDKPKAADSDEGDKKSNKFAEIFNQAKAVYNHPDKDEILKEIIILIKRLLKALDPDQLRLESEFGFEAPDTTGMVLGAAGIIKAMIFKDNYKIYLKGNFNEKIFNINAGLRGKLSLWSGLWPLLAFIFKKPVWKIISAKLFNKNNSERNV